MTNLELQQKAVEVRKGIIEGVHAAKSGHPGGSLSAAEVFTYLYFEEMNVDPKDPKMANRDRFVLSKGHTAPGLYAALAKDFSNGRYEDITSYWLTSSGTSMVAHTPGIDASWITGTGNFCSSGMALSAKLSNDDYRVYTLLGDGKSRRLSLGSIYACRLP